MSCCDGASVNTASTGITSQSCSPNEELWQIPGTKEDTESECKPHSDIREQAEGCSSFYGFVPQDQGWNFMQNSRGGQEWENKEQHLHDQQAS